MPLSSKVGPWGTAALLRRTATRALRAAPRHVWLRHGTRCGPRPPASLMQVDPLVSLMKVEKVPDSTYDMVGGLDQQIKEIKEASDALRLFCSAPAACLL